MSVGLSGVRLFSAAAAIGVLFEVDDPRLDAFWLRAQELAIPVDLQIRYPAIAAVRRVLGRYPSVRVVLDHLGGAPVTGGPPYRAAAGLLELAECDGVHVKFANHNLEAADEADGSTAEGFLERLVAAFGADRVLWGSNFPNTFGRSPATSATYTAMVSRVARYGLPPRRGRGGPAPGRDGAGASTRAWPEGARRASSASIPVTGDTSSVRWR